MKGFLSPARSMLDGVTGEILANDFGPAGSPGAIPTSIAGAPQSAPAAALKQSLIAQLARDGTATNPDDIAIAGVFARVTLNGMIAFYKLEDGAWKPLAAGTMFSPESMERLGCQGSCGCNEVDGEARVG